jgi:hypothetical protein
MSQPKDQHNVGTPEKPRGQEMGRGEYHNPNRDAMEDTPALRGDRKDVNKMFADDSNLHVASHGSGLRDNSPSVPAAMPEGKIGESGGETEFKQRQAKRQQSK